MHVSVVIWVIALEVFVVFFISAAIGGVVGAFIDGQRGALWGFFLGPIGWIISAILKKPGSAISSERVYEQTSPRESFARTSNDFNAVAPVLGKPKAEQSLDVRKWAVLKEVDAEVRAASARVSELDPALDAILAEKYLILNQKEYLEGLTDLVVSSYAEKQLQEAARAEQLGTAIFDSGQRQKIEYENSLGADRIDHQFGSRVQSVDIYAGSWAGLTGGIRITLEDGRTMLRNKSMRRDFGVGDDSWK